MAFPGTDSSTVYQDVYIETRDSRIVKIYKKGEVPRDLPSDVEIDATNYFVLPGLTDLHVHLTHNGESRQSTYASPKSSEYQTLTALKNSMKSLEAGFTTLRDAGATGAQVIALRDAIENKVVRGPRIFAAGIPIGATGGHADGLSFRGRICDGPDEVRKGVREQIKMGADLIKLMASQGGGGGSPRENPNEPELTIAEISTAVEEAHSRHRKVAAHAHSTIGIKNAIRGGVDTIEHGLFMDSEACALMNERETILVPTMSAPIMVAKAGQKMGDSDWHVKRVLSYLDIHGKSVRLAKEAGIPIGFGTDSGTVSNFHGENAKEFGFLVSSGGLSEGEALYASTGVAATALGLQSELGTIGEGRFADLIFVKGNPLEKIESITDPANIRMVMKEGRIEKCLDPKLWSVAPQVVETLIS
jgi:imidazolonepropionase-like amidohydrolase